MNEIEQTETCTRCGDSLGRYPVDGKCNNCARNAIADLWALARGLFVFVSCELEAERNGWVRLRCLSCHRSPPEVELRQDYDGSYECCDRFDCDKATDKLLGKTGE